MKLEVFQSLWAMQLRRPDGFEWSEQERFEKIAEAGFAGVCLDYRSEEIETRGRPLLPLFEKHGLKLMLNAFATSIENLQPFLDFAKESDAVVINIIGEVFPFEVEEGARVIQGWLDLAERSGVPILIETHRNCISNDLFYTLQVMDLVPDMKLCADLSHYMVDREFAYPLNDHDQGLIDRILERSDSFQGRVSSREQVQIPLAFPQSEKWVELYKSWWRKGMTGWKARHQEGDCLNFLCELGPPEYAITGADGYELSDRWEEALQIKQWVEALWDEV